MTKRFTRLSPPVRMIDFSPPLDCTWQQFLIYEAELVLELYIQGRSFDEVAEIAGCSADDVREMARITGVRRPLGADHVLAQWRAASQRKLAQTARTDLLYAWMDGAEPEDLADKYDVPADLMWDAIADEMAKTTRKDLLRRPTARPPTKPVHCVDVCDFACTHRCGFTTHANGGPYVDGTYVRPSSSPWPPKGRVNPSVTVGMDGRAAWRDRRGRMDRLPSSSFC